MSARIYLPQREQWMCVCGHPVEDHGASPGWPCEVCSCKAFCENKTEPLFDLEELIK